MINKIDCKEAEKRINLYFSNQLEDEEITELFDHMDECDSCKEEFTIQHLVVKSMSDFDDDMDSSYEIALKRKEIQRRFHVKDIAERSYLGFIYLGVSAICFAILLIVL